MFINQGNDQAALVAHDTTIEYGSKQHPDETPEEELARLKKDHESLKAAFDILANLRGPTQYQDALDIKINTVVEVVDRLHSELEELKKGQKPKAKKLTKPKPVQKEEPADEDPQDAHMHAEMEKEPEKVTK